MDLITLILSIFAGIILLLVLVYFLKPELLTLPYSAFLRLFVSNPPIVEKEKYFPESKILEANWREIRQELMEVLKNEQQIPTFHEVDSIQKYISASDDVPWRTFGIKAFDKWVEPNASIVPLTKNLLSKMPNVNIAMFSILGPGKRIPKHFGFFKGVFRYHLGLMVPKNGECYIINGGVKYHWVEGEGILFDDTFVHEVWNNTDETRVVLFLDVFRDESLPRWLRPLNKKMTNLLAGSKRISKGIKNAEVSFDIEENSTNEVWPGYQRQS